jgi:putative spermidine/putrescine transport system substrate-binding protein
MVSQISRRHFIGSAVGLGAAGAGMLALPERGRAAVTLTGVQWGGPWVNTAKAITERQDQWRVNWELHTGGSATIIPKIRASWPNVAYDFVAQYDPLYYIWAEQDWPEPLSVEEMPAFRDVPDEIFHRNAKGEIINVPITVTGTVFGFRKDIMPVEIRRIEDLLNPKLKGKVIIRDAVAGDTTIVQFAVAFGGDERNMDPGWDFLKKLVKSGNVGRVARAEVDFINALTSGECAVGCWNVGGWRKVAENFPCEFLILDKREAPGLQMGLINEGYMIPKASRNKAETKRYLNWFISPENNEEYNKAIGAVPVNLKSKPGDFAQRFFFKTKEDRERFTRKFAFDVLAAKKNDVINRFETEIAPFIR